MSLAKGAVQEKVLFVGGCHWRIELYLLEQELKL